MRTFVEATVGLVRSTLRVIEEDGDPARVDERRDLSRLFFALLEALEGWPR